MSFISATVIEWYQWRFLCYTFCQFCWHYSLRACLNSL